MNNWYIRSSVIRSIYGDFLEPKICKIGVTYCWGWDEGMIMRLEQSGKEKSDSLYCLCYNLIRDWSQKQEDVKWYFPLVHKKVFSLTNHSLEILFLLLFLYVTANCLKSHYWTLFLHVWRRGRLALDPLQNKSCSEFSQAYKNWHITWGNNLGPDWPPLARGSKFHTITHPPGRFLPSPRQWKIMSL